MMMITTTITIFITIPQASPFHALAAKTHTATTEGGRARVCTQGGGARAVGWVCIGICIHQYNLVLVGIQSDPTNPSPRAPVSRRVADHFARQISHIPSFALFRRR